MRRGCYGSNPIPTCGPASGFVTNCQSVIRVEAEAWSRAATRDGHAGRTGKLAAHASQGYAGRFLWVIGYERWRDVPAELTSSALSIIVLGSWAWARPYLLVCPTVGTHATAYVRVQFSTYYMLIEIFPDSSTTASMKWLLLFNIDYRRRASNEMSVKTLRSSLQTPRCRQDLSLQLCVSLLDILLVLRMKPNAKIC